MKIATSEINETANPIVAFQAPFDKRSIHLIVCLGISLLWSSSCVYNIFCFPNHTLMDLNSNDCLLAVVLTLWNSIISIKSRYIYHTYTIFCWAPNVFKTLFLLSKLSPYQKYQTKEKYINLYVSLNCIENKNIQYWTSMILDLRSSSFSLVVCTPTDCKYITHIPQWKITVFVSFSSFWVSEGEQ